MSQRALWLWLHRRSSCGCNVNYYVISLEIEAHWLFSLNMGRRKKWSTAARSSLATIRGRLGPRRKGVEGLCVSSLLGVLRSHIWLIGEEEVALLLTRTSSPRWHHHHYRAHSLSFSVCSSSADGGSEDLADPRSPSLDPHLSHIGQGKQPNLQREVFFKLEIEKSLQSWQETLCLPQRLLFSPLAFMCSQWV